MKQLDEEFRARLEAGILTTCLCWELVREDGLVAAITDHDRPVTYDGVEYGPGAAHEAGRFESAGGLKPGRAAARGALSADAISDDDLAAGLWNGAKVHVFRVDWAEPQYGVLVWSGYFSEIEQAEAGFESGLVSLKADLERPLGRTYSRRCDARLGDARCGLSSVDGQTCDKRFATCRDIFSNTANFRGFPHMPSPDFILAGPAATGNDGGKR